jgi:tyrosyl-tRNA synthetase
VVGGSTGLIGDPSFKAQERQLNTPDIVQSWCDRLRRQIEAFVEFEGVDNAAILTNNYDWTAGISVLDFLRDVGKHFSINAMIQKESVKQRIEREGSGISFTEFSYMLLQSWDFAELYRLHGCTMQVGGSDQWGNITGGIDLTRRLHGAQVFGLTMPLITKSDGTKFGKTESGTIWLDPSKTSPYAFYQFWINCSDADVYRFLKYFTFLPVEEIDRIEAEDAAREGRPVAQKILAQELTRLVHGESALVAAENITESLFSGEIGQLSESDCEQLLLDGLPSAHLGDYKLDEMPLTRLLVDTGLSRNGSQVKDALGRNAVFVNGKQVGMESNMSAASIFASDQAMFGKYFIARLGKKQYQILTLGSS